MIKKMVVLFFLSKKRQNRRGLAPIYCRVTVSGRRKDFGTGIYIDPDLWINGEIKSEKQEHTVYSAMLDTLKAKLLSIFFELQNRGLSTDPTRIINIAKGKEAVSTPFLRLIDDFIRSQEKRGLKLISVRKYGIYKKNIERFFKEIGRSSILPGEFRVKVAEEFRMWLYKNLKSCGRSHASRHIEFCRAALKFAVRQEIIEVNPLGSVETGRDPVKKIIECSEEDMMIMAAHRFQSKILNQARDLFLFQCDTGLSYADLSRFELKLKFGREWIESGRAKGEYYYSLPLFSNAKKIYDCYNGNLPRISNQVYNRVLKEIAAICGIEKHLTTHVARKTFATIRDKEGWSLESISRMLGHQETKTTQTHYLKPNDERIYREMIRICA